MEIKFNHCPWCEQVIKNLQTQVKEKPRRGDLVVCDRCGKPSQWQGEMELRRLQPADILALPKSSKDMLMAVMFAVAETNAKRN